ncbi:integrase [Streptomyces mirabilis]|uniref:integrase n=1 Tax=Streptomyces mirabilis TaxID=68239 RepID=UPI00368D6304
MGVVLRVVRSLSDPDACRATGRLGALEGELVDRFVLAGMGAGFTDRSVADDRATFTQFAAFLGRGLWAVQPADVDAWLAGLHGQGLARATVYDRANTLARFYAFVIARYQQEVQARDGGRVRIQVCGQLSPG